MQIDLKRLQIDYPLTISNEKRKLLHNSNMSSAKNFISVCNDYQGKHHFFKIPTTNKNALFQNIQTIFLGLEVYFDDRHTSKVLNVADLILVHNI